MANILTFSRIIISLAIPIGYWLVINFSKNFNEEKFFLFLLILFILASISDFLDGFIARKWNQESDIGKILDPIADKLLVIISLIILIISFKENPIIFFSSILIIFREILISGLREITKSSGLILNVTKLSKWKTAAQLGSIILLFLNIFYYNNSYDELIFPLWIYKFSYFIGNLLILIASLLSILSAYRYAKETINFIKEKD
jgi:CDP-diacylglycerol--glycerol-3-phosphate 3-phosphatidyltransferase